MLHGAGGLVAWRPLSGPGRLLLVASDAVGAVAALIIVVFALGGAFPKSPRLLVDATACGIKEIFSQGVTTSKNPTERTVRGSQSEEEFSGLRILSRSQKMLFES